MKRFVALLLLLCIVFTMMPALADAEYIGNMEVVNCNEWVSLREKPSVSARRSRLMSRAVSGVKVWRREGYSSSIFSSMGRVSSVLAISTTTTSNSAG